MTFAASRLVRALENLWSAVRVHHPDLPIVVMVVASGTEATTMPRWGHWGAARWSVQEGGIGEVLVAGEALGEPAWPEFVTGVVLHEAAHALAHARRLADTSRDGRYHNRVFRDLADELGLDARRDAYGWMNTTIREDTAMVYAEAISELREAADHVHRARVCRAHRAPPRRRRDVTNDIEETGTAGTWGDEEGGSVSSVEGEAASAPRATRELYVCACEAPRRLRIVPSVAERGPILCGLCNHAFEPAE